MAFSPKEVSGASIYLPVISTMMLPNLSLTLGLDSVFEYMARATGILIGLTSILFSGGGTSFTSSAE
jgi:hypothetical protein